MKKIIAPIFAIATLFAGTAYAQETMDARQADESTVSKRQVVYQCQSGKSFKVTYGFNKQKLPTFASINVNGKQRFMPINLAHSDMTGTTFGDDNNYSLSTEALTLNNYQKSTAMVFNPASEILYKNCRVKSTKKVR